MFFIDLIKLIISFFSKLSAVISSLYKYRAVYTVTGVFATRKFPKTENLHRYAVLIAARNEETVIENLIDSIKDQDYPSGLVSVFVVADNCTDRTAQIARENGAVCYERFDSEHRTKGFALQFLVKQIERDYGIDAFEGYFIFDADNLLKKDYISRMNEAFDAGEKIVTSYRNTKNFSDNWISASYGIHWLRTIRTEHRARSLFRLATRIQGTGFLFASELIRNGWNYTSLTEDRAFCADAVANGYTISYNNAAEFYDEQPTDIKIAMRQRIRWARGHLEAFVETGPKLFRHIFLTRGVPNNNKTDVFGNPLPPSRRFINNLRLRFMSFDMLTVVFPRGLYTTLKRVITVILRSILIFAGAYHISLKLLPAEFRSVIDFLGGWSLPDGIAAQISLLIAFTLSWLLYSYLSSILLAAYVFIAERRHIAKTSFIKKVWFCITFPMFDIIGKIATVIALFGKVEWKPIPHKVSISVDKVK
ncbi:MAG: glycosyltransferase family 2 protein [Clostridia bacterium]|nr:glycosyltransferase family 2 protein [Clostridia bacterium]